MKVVGVLEIRQAVACDLEAIEAPPAMVDAVIA
jgi:hypothetical protein